MTLSKEMKRYLQNGGKIFANHIAERNLFSEYIKNTYNSIKKRQSNLKMSRDLNEYFSKYVYIYIQFSRVQLFMTPWTAARQASPSITNSWSLPKPCPLWRWCHPTISFSVNPFSSSPQSFPASGSFPMSQLFASGGQSIGVSASTSVLPMNSQDWSPLEWTGWISLQSKGLSRVFSNTTVHKHQFFGTQLSLLSNSHIHTWPLEKP